MGINHLKHLTALVQNGGSVLSQRIEFRIGSARSAIGVSLLVISLLLSACNTATPQATIVPQQPAASSTPQPTATSIPPTAPANANAPQQASLQTALDPCQLISSQDAATLTGVTFGEGIEGTVPGGGKTCTYGSQTTNVFYIEVAQAPDEASAKAAQDQFISDLQANLQQLISGGFVVSQLASFADGAVTATLNVSAGGITVNGSAFGFRKGTVFFGFSDVTEGGAAPSDTAMQNQAQTVLDMLP